MKRRKFINLVGSSAAIMTSSKMLFAFQSVNDSEIEEKLKEWSFAAFRRYEEVWNFNDFWKRGNTFYD
jgi:hypothetical protein